MDFSFWLPVDRSISLSPAVKFFRRLVFVARAVIEHFVVEVGCKCCGCCCYLLAGGALAHFHTFSDVWLSAGCADALLSERRRR